MKNQEDFDHAILAIRDTLDLVGGKWKLPIIHALKFDSPLRFNELQRKVTGITSRMLSKELKELEINKMVKREVFDTSPITVMYELTKNGESLCPVLDAMYKWGMEHRRRIFSETEVE